MSGSKRGRTDRTSGPHVAPSGRFFLIPWHIGDVRDLTFNALSLVRRLDFLLVEDVESARRDLIRLRADPRAKTLVAVPRDSDPALTARVLSALAGGDVGLVASGGIASFVDPGAWLVSELRRLGVSLVATAGASALTTMLALSGIEWRAKTTSNFTFAMFFDEDGDGRADGRFIALARRREPLFVFLKKSEVARCMALLEPVVKDRPVTLYFDLAKSPPEKFPLSGVVRARACSQWRRELSSLPWDRIDDVSLMVGP